MAPTTNPPQTGVMIRFQERWGYDDGKVDRELVIGPFDFIEQEGGALIAEYVDSSERYETLAVLNTTEQVWYWEVAGHPGEWHYYCVYKGCGNDTPETLLSIPGVWEAVSEDPATHSAAIKLMEEHNSAYRCSECCDDFDEELSDGLCPDCNACDCTGCDTCGAHCLEDCASGNGEECSAEEE